MRISIQPSMDTYFFSAHLGLLLYQSCTLAEKGGWGQLWSQFKWNAWIWWVWYTTGVASVISVGVCVPQSIVCLGGPGLKLIFSRLQGQGSGLLPLTFIFALTSIFCLLTSVVPFLSSITSFSLQSQCGLLSARGGLSMYSKYHLQIFRSLIKVQYTRVQIQKIRISFTRDKNWKSLFPEVLNSICSICKFVIKKIF